MGPKFFTLPPGLRTMIYEQVIMSWPDVILLEEDLRQVQAYSANYKKQGWGQIAGPACRLAFFFAHPFILKDALPTIMRVCKTRLSMQSLLVAEQGPKAFNPLADLLQPECTHVILEVDHAKYRIRLPGAVRVLGTFSRLTTLELEVDTGSVGHMTAWRAKRCYRLHPAPFIYHTIFRDACPMHHFPKLAQVGVTDATLNREVDEAQRWLRFSRTQDRRLYEPNFDVRSSESGPFWRSVDARLPYWTRQRADAASFRVSLEPYESEVKRLLGHVKIGFEEMRSARAECAGERPCTCGVERGIAVPEVDED